MAYSRHFRGLRKEAREAGGTAQEKTTIATLMQNKIRWGIIGAGTIAWKFASGLKLLPGATLYGVASQTPSRLEKFGRHFEVPRVYKSYGDLVCDENIDVVYIATLNHLHRDHSLLCLNAGKPVLCEKPFCVSAAEAREVINLARQKKLFCMEAMRMRFVPLMAKLRDLVGSGAIGDVLMVTADLGFAAAYEQDNRFFKREFGGGSMLDLGIYPLSFISSLLGKPEAISSHAHIGKTRVDEQAAAILRYPSGKLGVISTSLMNNLPGEATVSGTRGWIRVHSPMHCPSKLSLTIFPEQNNAIVRDGSVHERTDKRSLLRIAFSRARQTISKFTKKSRPLHFPIEGNGHHYEAVETMRCLHARELESKIMPLDETLNIMETMDEIRGGWVDQTMPGSI